MAMPAKVSEWRTIDLKGTEVKPLKFLSADVPAERHMPFALIHYLVIGTDPPKTGLRLDLDKRVFLDRLENPDEEKAAREAIPTIIDILRRSR
jgi:hypothetical protein